MADITFTAVARLDSKVRPTFGYVQRSGAWFNHEVWVPAGQSQAIAVHVRPSRLKFLVAQSDRPMTVLTGGGNEVQRISITSTVLSTLKIRVTFGASTSGDIQCGHSAATVQATLEAMGSIGSGNVSVSGGPLESAPLDVAFIGSLGFTNVAEMSLTLVDPGITGAAISTITNGASGSTIFAVKASHPLAWWDTHWAACPFTTDRDSITVLNSSAKGGTFRLRYLHDSED